MRLLFTFYLFFSIFNAEGQSVAKSSSELFEDIKRLSNSQTVMYIAAHPDDENTRLISWLTNAQHAETYYLSLTRGDGGQNLIGTEKGSSLGVLRTQELLQARTIDGGQQLFTRANDFGFSKNVDETLTIWSKTDILGDVVYAIRKYQPDIIITRFDPDSNGKTHGHHTTSALLAMEAFDLAGNPSAYPEQLSRVSTWSPERLFFNTSWWFYGSRENFEKADKSNLFTVDIGTYYPSLGISNNEIAALSRSQHACQGFGSSLKRGSEIEYLELLKGSKPNTQSIFDGISSRYNSVIQTQFDQLIKSYNYAQPEASFEQLSKIYSSLSEHPQSRWRDRKLVETTQILLQLKGIYREWVSDSEYAIPGDDVETTIEISNRGSQPVLVNVQYNNHALVENQSVASNQSVTNSNIVTLNPELQYDNPYWLIQHMKNIGQYVIEDPNLLGLAESPKKVKATIHYDFGSIKLVENIDLKYKTVDPAIGEIYEPFYIVPKATININQPVYLFSNNDSQDVTVTITAFEDDLSGTAQLWTDGDWKISSSQSFHMKHKGDVEQIKFTVKPPQKDQTSNLFAKVKIGNEEFSKSFTVVDYNHIDKQYIFQESKAQIGKVNLKVPNVKVAYIEGSGDDVVESLQQIGVNIEVVDENNWSSIKPQNYDVALVGIRAFNILDHSERLVDQLNQFAQEGGTVIIQYQTYRGLKVDQFTPYSLTIGRDRIAEEDAELTILNRDHAVFNNPNVITSDDFANWVQERGLYFATEWDDNFTPLLEGHDTGEDMKQGMLLLSDYGKGKVVYTGLSFFRELPAGVPGSYRLIANLLALD